MIRMKVQLVKLRLWGRKLTRDELVQAEPLCGHLQIDRSTARLLARPGASKPVLELSDATVSKIKEGDLIVVGKEMIRGSEGSSAYHLQAWWCRTGNQMEGER